MMLDGEVTYGSWVDWHNTWAEELKTNPNMFLFHFEDFRKDNRTVFRKVAKFLGVELTAQLANGNIKVLFL